jgi:hypothetical protein
LWTYRNGVITRYQLSLLSPDYNNFGGRLYADVLGNIVIPVDNDTWGAAVASAKAIVSHSFGASPSVITICSLADGSKLFYTSIIVDSNGVLWACTQYQKTTTRKAMLYKSTNLGDSWTYVNEQAFAASNEKPLFAIDGVDLYIGESGYFGVSPGKLYKSTNGGVTFNLITTFTGKLLYGLEVASGTICVYTYNNSGSPIIGHIERSINAGTSWTSVKTVSDAGGYDNFIAMQRIRTRGGIWIMTGYELALNDKLLYLQSIDDGITWTDVPSTVTYEEGTGNAYAEQYSEVVVSEPSPVFPIS